MKALTKPLEPGSEQRGRRTIGPASGDLASTASRLLAEMREGDLEAEGHLWTLLFDELHARAVRAVQSLPVSDTLQLILPASITDAGVGALMARAGVLGAVYNVRINLPSITDAAWVAEQRAQLDALVEEANAVEGETLATVDAGVEAG